MTSPSPLSIAKTLLPYALLWLVVVGALTATTVMQIASDRERDVADARARLDELAAVLADNAARALDAIDRTLAVVKAVHERSPSQAPLDTLVETLRLGDDVERGVALFDRNGRLLGAMGPGRAIWDARPIDFDDAATHQGNALRVQRPVRLAHTWVVAVAKRLEGVGGDFDGVVASALDTSKLLGAHREPPAQASAAVGVASASGRVVAVSGGAGAAGEVPGVRGAGAAVEWVVLDGRRQLVAVRGVGGSGLAAFASLDEGRVLASNRLFVANALALLLVAVAAITLPIAFVARRAGHELFRRHRLAAGCETERGRPRTDAVTGLSNRVAFDEHLKNCHLLLARYGKPFVLAIVDVDHFGKVNDEHGRESGDRALRQLGQTMRNAVRQSDLVARLGDDAFAILMPGARVATIKRVFDQLRAALGVDAAIGGWPITFSVGVVAFESAPPRPVDAFNAADSLLHEVKGLGRDGIRYAVYRDHELLNGAHVAA